MFIYFIVEVEALAFVVPFINIYASDNSILNFSSSSSFLVWQITTPKELLTRFTQRKNIVKKKGKQKNVKKSSSFFDDGMLFEIKYTFYNWDVVIVLLSHGKIFYYSLTKKKDLCCLLVFVTRISSSTPSTNFLPFHFFFHYEAIFSLLLVSLFRIWLVNDLIKLNIIQKLFFFFFFSTSIHFIFILIFIFSLNIIIIIILAVLTTHTIRQKK
jgi:hypothetical protein